MAAKNDITGDELISKPTTDSYADGWERIFGKKEKTIQDIAQEHPNSDQFNQPTERDKAVNKFDHLKWCMEGQLHIDRPEYVDDVIISVMKFEAELNEGEIAYIKIAQQKLEDGQEWEWEIPDITIVNEDDGYAD